jgi:DNA-binding NtrC family response regulator
LSTNARVIVATHRNLEQLVREERFREDLYYRINVFRVLLPQLAERKEDIPLLVDFFIQRFNLRKGRSIKGIAHEALSALMAYDWPGNVRELENAIEHAFILCRNDFIRIEELPANLVAGHVPFSFAGGTTLKEIERSAIIQMLRRHKGKKVAAATALGIDKNTLRRKMIRLQIH